MDIQQVEIVLSIARHLNFSEAAWELSYSASTVSKKLSALEEELGVRLFERKARSKVLLSEEGRILLQDFEMIKAAADQLQQSIDHLAGSKAKKLTVGSTSGLSTLGEDELLVDFNAIYPEVEVSQIEVKRSVDLIPLLLSREVDALFTLAAENGTADAFRRSGLEGIHLGETRLNLAVSEYHPALRNGEIDLADLKEETFLFHAFSSKMEQDKKVKFFIAACEEEGFSPKIQFLRMRHAAVFELVAAGQGIAPMMHIPKTVHPAIRVVPCSKLYYSFAKMLYYSGSNQSAALKNFITFINQRQNDEQKMLKFENLPFQNTE